MCATNAHRTCGNARARRVQMLGQAAQIRKASLKAHHKNGIGVTRVLAHQFFDRHAMKLRYRRQIHAKFAAIHHGNLNVFANIVCSLRIVPNGVQAALLCC